jgi:hypothetical protein
MLKIPRTHLLSEIRAAGFRFISGKQRSSDAYRLRGGTDIVAIPRTDLVAEEGARRILKRAGRTHGEIAAFLAAHGQENP